MCDEEIFEINDFSTSSDWERFISDLEEILTYWNLNNYAATCYDISQTLAEEQLEFVSNTKSSKLFSDSRRWQQQQESVKFGKVSFSLQYFCFKKDSASNQSSISIHSSNVKSSDRNQAWQDMNSIENDWPASGHPLVRYYGLSQFLVLLPLNGETIGTEDRARHLIGSASIALHNLNCEIPFFCQISSLSRQLFMGVGHVSSGFRTYFEMIQFPVVPPSFQYFDELMVLFKKKLNSSFSYNTNVVAKEELMNPNSTNDAIPKVQISIRFTYILTKWPTEYLLFNQSSERPILSEQFSYFRQQNSNFKMEQMIRKPVLNFVNLIGDPLKQIQLATTWPSVAEELITDNAYHSDLQPRNAPRWSLRALFHDNCSIINSQQNFYCQTVELLKTFSQLQVHQHSGPLLNLLANHYNNEDSTNDVRSALDRLSSPSTSMDLTTTTSQLITSVSNLVLSGSNRISMKNIEIIVKNIFEYEPKTEPESLQSLEELKQLKSSPYDSLSWRLANLCLNLYAQSKYISTLAQVWKCFLDILRDYWQSGRYLPHLSGNSRSEIDYGTCIFHQKLQMLNCCIAQKVKCEYQEKQDSDKFEENSDDAEEFFDAEDEEQFELAEGQLHPLNDAKGQPVYLLSNPLKHIQVPHTQDPAPMTEDALAKLVSLLSQIEDSKTKVCLQSAGLLSDMEAFKAANPGCQFEDFIRWHSPRDWVAQATTSDATTQDKMTEFGLSRRMRESTTWNELWELACPCPVRRQKRLFNYTKEAEEILQYFQNITIGDFVQLLNPIVAKSVTQQLLQDRQEILNFLQENLVNLDRTNSDQQLLQLDMSSLERLLAQGNYLNLSEHLFNLEYEIIKFYSLFQKFSHSYEVFFHGKSFQEILSSSSKSNLKQPNSNKITQTSVTKQNLTRLKSMSKSFSRELTGQDFLRFILDLLREPEVEFSNTNVITQLIVQIFADSDRFQYEQSTSVGDRLPHHQVNSFDGNSVLTEQSSTIRLSNKLSSTLPPPIGKEFIIRAQSIPRPAPYSRSSSHRMYCLLSKEFRVATAFTEDTAYF